jgi:hypothetical protein
MSSCEEVLFKLMINPTMPAVKIKIIIYLEVTRYQRGAIIMLLMNSNR